jgi:hypothetical protein
MRSVDKLQVMVSQLQKVALVKEEEPHGKHLIPFVIHVLANGEPQPQAKQLSRPFAGDTQSTHIRNTFPGCQSAALRNI